MLEPIRDFVLEQRAHIALADDADLISLIEFFISDESALKVASLLKLENVSDERLHNLFTNARHFLQIIEKNSAVEGEMRFRLLHRYAHYISESIKVFDKLGMQEAASHSLDNAIAYAREYSDLAGVAAWLRVSRANAWYILGRKFDLAGEDLRFALPILISEGQFLRAVFAQQRMGVVHQFRGEFAEARKWYFLGLESARKWGDLDGYATSLSLLGWLAEDKNEFVKAARLYRTAKSLHERVGSQLQLIIDVTALGKIARELIGST